METLDLIYLISLILVIAWIHVLGRRVDRLELALTSIIGHQERVDGSLLVNAQSIVDLARAMNHVVAGLDDGS